MNGWTQLHGEGVVIGLGTFLIIGAFHPLVIRGEYYFGTRCWWVFLLLGAAAIGWSLCAANTVVSALAGVLAFTSLWSIKELFEQKRRVERGWFPRNSRRKNNQK